MSGECQVCEELWRQYALATSALDEAEARLTNAGSHHDHTAVKRLLAELRVATRERADIEFQIESHEHEAHPGETRAGEPERDAQRPDRRLYDVERAHIERIVSEVGQNLSKAARILDIDRSTLYSKLRRYGLK